MTSAPPRRTVQPPCEESPASLRLGQLSEAGPKQGQQQRGLAPLERFERPGRSQHRRSSQPASAAIPGGSSRPEPGPPHIGRRRLHGEARSPGRPIPSRGHTARRSLTRSSSTSHRRSQRPGGGGSVVVGLHQPRAEAQKALQPAPFGRLPSSSSPSGCRRQPTRRP